MEVELLHGDDLSIASSCGASFDAEGGPLRRLANARDGLLTEMSAQSLDESNRSGALSLAQRSGVDAGRDHIVAVPLMGKSITHREVDLAFNASIEVIFTGKNTNLLYT